MNISIGSRTISFSDVKETVESYIRKFTSKILEKIDDAYNYDGGLYIIKDFNGGNKIKLTTDAIGIEISEDNFVLKSSSGVLTIENGRSKVIDFSDGNGNTGVYAYVAGDSGVVDGRIFANFEIIVGANDKSNSLIAGDGGSNLWGGAGFSADILVGGLGIDHFSIGKSEGNDHIANAARRQRYRRRVQNRLRLDGRKHRRKFARVPTVGRHALFLQLRGVRVAECLN